MISLTPKFLVVCMVGFAFSNFAFADMSASLSDGVLRIIDTGSNPNSVFSVEFKKDDLLRVEASSDDWSSKVVRSFDATDVERILIFTGIGNDHVIISSTVNVGGTQTVQSYPDIDVEIQTGAGDDRVFILGADVGDMSIQTGAGNDNVRCTAGSVFNEDLLVETSGGNDDVSFLASTVHGLTVVTTGGGNDQFETHRSMFVRRVEVDGGPNMDQLSFGGPKDFSYRENCFIGPLLVHGGSGRDTIEVGDGEYFFVRIDGGSGLDCYTPYGTYQFDDAFRLFNVNTCRPEFPYGSFFEYKTVVERNLRLILVKPTSWSPSDSRPAVLFFHGGGWIGGSRTQFLDQSKYLAKQGVVCGLIEYRLLDPDENEPPVVCIQDARSAMRYVRANAAQFGIDPNRIAAGGGSAGGHLAAYLGTTDGLDDPQDDLAVSARADAMLLFNPVYDNGPGGWGTERVGDRYPEFSPLHNITPDDAPHVVFHGSEDHLIPAATVRRFRNLMAAVGVKSELRLYEGAGHGFFNRSRDDGIWYRKTVIAMHRFLNELGWIEGPPSIVDLENVSGD
jgi:acetyl esterase/lipase